MFTIPAKLNFPKFIQENIDAGWQSLSDAIDNLYYYVREYEDKYKNINDAGRTPKIFLDELGYLLQAGILNNDTDQQKRKKILNAIESHKKRGVFQFDTKPRLDTITGYNARIYRYDDSDDAVWLASSNDVNADKNWMTWQGYGQEKELIGTIGSIDYGTPPGHMIPGFSYFFSLGQKVQIKTLNPFFPYLPPALTDGGIYYVIPDTPSPGNIRLATTQSNAISGTAIDLGPISSTCLISVFRFNDTPGYNAQLGIWWVRLKTVVSGVIAGVISIDLHEGITEPILTQDIIDKCVQEITPDIVPAYMQVQLGYIDNNGFFQTYVGGVV